MVDDNYKFLDWGPHRLIWVESARIDSCIEVLRRENLDGIAISKSMGYELSDVDFLREHTYLNGLIFSYAKGIDISALSSLQNLRLLSVAENSQPLSLSWFPQLREVWLEWHKAIDLYSDSDCLRILSLRRYRPTSKDLTELPPYPGLHGLEIIQSPLVSVEGVQKYSHLKRLELAYLPKLVHLQPFESCSLRELEILEISKCPSLAEYDALGSLTSLNILRLFSCNDIPNLGFLNTLSELKDFRFLETNVTDGDLSPILSLKLLEGVGFTNKRHFSHKARELRNLLGIQ